MNSIFLDKLHGKSTSRPPVWFMRQAGRVLPDYRQLRERYSFHHLMTDPHLAAQVTLMPVDDLGVDAAILFSDILVIPIAMGMELEWTDKGPVFVQPLAEAKNPIELLHPAPEKLEYIYKVIDQILITRKADTPLIGFCGAPLTVLCYMLQGLSSKMAFPDALRFFYTHRAETLRLLDAVTEMTIYYAECQIEHGIDAFQIFDTHAGVVPTSLYTQIFLPAVRRIADAIRAKNVPLIYFPKGLGCGLQQIDKSVCDYVGIDWQTDIRQARKMIPKEVGLQGNLDPRLLYAHQNEITAVLESYKPFFSESPNWIFNLGHGVQADTDVERLKGVVDWIKTTQW